MAKMSVMELVHGAIYILLSFAENFRILIPGSQQYRRRVESSVSGNDKGEYCTNTVSKTLENLISSLAYWLKRNEDTRLLANVLDGFRRRTANQWIWRALIT